jgi:hypothetical protein
MNPFDCMPDFRHSGSLSIAVWVVLILSGCGTTRFQTATEQLVLSDALDRSISQIDFRPLSGHTVYFDTSYLKSAKPDNIVNSEYVISSLRQQLMAAGCFLQDKSEEAEIIVEARVGTLGLDDHRLTYGIPETKGLGPTVSMVAGAPVPVPPTLPEIAVARREAREGAAKVAAFAYDRATKQAIWQSGISRSDSVARDTWVLGIGPFRRGTIRNEPKFADKSLVPKFMQSPPPPPQSFDGSPMVDYNSMTVFQDQRSKHRDQTEIQQASHEESPNPTEGNVSKKIQWPIEP